MLRVQPPKNHGISDQAAITDPLAVPILFHPEKQRILRILIREERTLQELSTELGMNPGVVKRHLVSLVKFNLVTPTREMLNEYGIKLKYYRAVAKLYVVSLKWP
jgi:predicted transcriptional regulator